MKALLIYRAPQFSPNSVENDRAILEATGQVLASRGVDVRFVNEERFAETPTADLVLTMGRLPETLHRLAEAEQRGVRVVNSALALSQASRAHIDRLMRQNGIPAAPLCDVSRPRATAKFWVKRGDMAAQSREDVQFAATPDELRQVVSAFRRRGVAELVATEHVAGDLVKFYGVGQGGFFRTFYPTDDGQSKFGDEQRNGQAHHYHFDADALRQDAARLSTLTGLAVYGGDCIVRPDGSYAIIDFNDWPSFSRCREEAAMAIVELGVRS